MQERRLSRSCKAVGSCHASAGLSVEQLGYGHRRNKMSVSYYSAKDVPVANYFSMVVCLLSDMAI